MIKDGVDKKEKIISFLMLGQSNMAGRGEFKDVEPIDNEKCYMLRMGRWQKMSEPINPDRAIWGIRFHSGVSLGASFADSFSKEFNCSVGLIPCADGGTTLSQWMPEELLFDHAVMMASLAKRTSEIGGILWHQGESDCINLDSKKYKENFIKMITKLREELGDLNLPVIIGELSEDISLEWVDKGSVKILNNTFYEISKEIKNCIVVSSKGITLKDDNLHINFLRPLITYHFVSYQHHIT